MEKTALSQKLEYVKQVLATAKQYDHAVNVLMYDQETICPIDGMEDQGEVMAFLGNESYKLSPLSSRRRSICMSTAVSWRSSTA